MHDAIEAFNQGVSYTQEHQYEHAIEAFSEAITLDPQMAMAYNGRAAIRALAGDTDNAIIDCNDAIRLDPKKALFYRTRGLICREMGDEANAEADLARAEELGLTPK